MQCLFEICTPRTHGAPDSERDQKTNKKKTKNKHDIFAPIAGAHCAIFPKLCTVIELVETIKNVCYSVFRLDALALSVIATATCLAGWVSVTLRYCIKTAKPI